MIKGYQIKKARSYGDAKIIASHIRDIWGDRVDEAYYQKMYTYCRGSRYGFIIGFLRDEPVASSIAFPVAAIPTFRQINEGNIFDLINHQGNYYYIHIVQVIAKYRNRGFGIKLLDDQINTAKVNHFHTITGMALDCELELWKRCGFIDFGRFGQYKHYGRMKWVKMSI